MEELKDEVPLRVIICYDEELANKAAGFGDGDGPHKVSYTMISKQKEPPGGFIEMPMGKNIEEIQDQYPKLYESLKSQGVQVFQ